MSSPLGSYERPGLSVVSSVMDADELALLPLFVERMLARFEQVVVAVADFSGPIEIPSHPRLRTVRVTTSNFWELLPGKGAHYTAARLVDHAVTVTLPVTARLTDSEALKLRALAQGLGPVAVSFRVPGDLLEHASHYRQYLYPSCWDAYVDPIGLLRHYDGQPCQRPVVVVDDLNEVQPSWIPPESAEAVAAELTPRPWTFIVSAPHTPTVLLGSLCEALGLFGGEGSSVVGKSRGRMNSRPFLEANWIMVQEARGAKRQWPWLSPVPIWSQLASDASLDRVAKCIDAAPTEGPLFRDDPMLALTLPIWANHGVLAQCIVALADPTWLAERLYFAHHIPQSDGLRIIRAYHEVLRGQLATVSAPTLVVDVKHLAEYPQAEAQRIAAALGRNPPQDDSWFTRGIAGEELNAFGATHLQKTVLAAQQSASAPTTSLTSRLLAAFRGEELPGEAEEVAAADQAFRSRCADTKPHLWHASPPPNRRWLALVWHDGPPSQLADFIDSTNAQSWSGQLSEIHVLCDAGAPSQHADPDHAAASAPRYSMHTLTSGLSSTLARILRESEATHVWLGTSRSRLTVQLLQSHDRCHSELQQLGNSGVFCGSVRLPGLNATCQDTALFTQIQLPNVNALHAPRFPENSSVPCEILQRCIRGADSGYDALLWFHVAQLIHVNSIPVAMDQEVVTVLTSGPGPEQQALQAERAGRALPQLLMRWPTLFSAGVLAKAVTAHAPQTLEVEHHRAALLASTDVTMTEDHRTHLTVILIEALLHCDPRVIRLLGRELWSKLLSVVPERWHPMDEPTRLEVLANNEARCRSLEGRHRGETVFIAGSGPQLGRLSPEARAQIEQHPVIGLNDAMYALKCTYGLSSYPVKIMTAATYPERPELIFHMRSAVAPPLAQDVLVVKRGQFPGCLPPTFSETPTLYTMQNVALGAVHLAVILGARHIVFIGVEQNNSSYFYSFDPAIRQRLVDHHATLRDGRFAGLDHPYERHAYICNLLRMSAEVKASYTDRYVIIPNDIKFEYYFNALRELGIRYTSTTNDNVVTRAGGPYVPLGNLLESLRGQRDAQHPPDAASLRQ